MRRVNGSKRKSYPVDAERLRNDGYLIRKVTDTGRGLRDWKEVHVLVWEEANGPVPPGHIVIFGDGDKSNVQLENLECISRREHIARHSIINLPDELKEVIWLKGALVRRINGHYDR